MQHHFFLINGFAERRGAGSPLAVFVVDALPNDAVMQQLAYQLNQPESVFVTRSADAIRSVAPQFPQPFSGLAQLAAAAVLHQQTGRCPPSLPGRYGPIRLSCDEQTYWFRAWPNRTQPAAVGMMELAGAIGVDTHDIAAPVQMVDSGLAQLLVPLHSSQAVLQASPHPALLAQIAANGQHIAQLTLWHREGDMVMLRCFSSDSFSVYEDFGAGAAVANLGGWLLATGCALPCRLKIEQGHTIHRPNTRLSVLHLRIGADRSIGVGGRLWIVGEGQIEL